MKFVLLVALGVLAPSADGSQDALEEFATGNTLLAADLYAAMPKSGDFVVSPLSVNLLLALARFGATGETAQEPAYRPYLPDNSTRLEEIFKVLTRHLQGNKKSILNIATKVYVQDRYGISDSFKRTAVDVFNADVQNVDFEDEQAGAKMNGWLTEKTHNKIQNLISPSVLNDDPFALLVSTMFFHGNWATRFNQENTRKRAFHNSESTEKEIDMMELTSGFKFYESTELDCKFLEMPYEGGEITMTIVLANDIAGLPVLEARIRDVLDAPKYGDFDEPVYVVLPKFKIETTVDLKRMLQSLGIRRAFSDDAQFTEVGSQREPLKIVNVDQQAFIEIEEKGTTAAVASDVVMDFIHAAPIMREPKEFIADRPLIYYLKSASAGIMFIGRFSAS